jgi:hypothetical protein
MADVRIGRIVIYRSRTGDYDVPAIITATQTTLNPKGVEAGHVPALSSPQHVHLTVFTPGEPGLREGAEDFKVESEHGRSENVAGCYQEWDVPQWGASVAWTAARLIALLDPKGSNEALRRALAPFVAEQDAECPPGSWRWPERV